MQRFLSCMLLRAGLPGLTALFLLAGLVGSVAQGGAMRLPVDPVHLVVVTAKGEIEFEIEIADEQRERQRGLMFRQSMPENRGMLFVFPAPGRQGFWMQNTPMALDLLFIDTDGTVLAIAPGIPFSTAAISPDVEAQFVLELRSGTAQKMGIQIGDRLRHPRITSAGTK